MNIAFSKTIELYHAHLLLFSLSDMAEAELAEADQGAIQSGEEEGREEPPQHYLLPEVENPNISTSR